jgi:putative transposase
MPKSVRFPHYDYSSIGTYFLTLCAHEHQCLLGEIADGIMSLSDYGRIVEREWCRTSEIRPELRLGDFVAMPNHIHGIVHIVENDGAHCRAALPEVYSRGTREREPHSISSFVAGFKAYTTKLANGIRATPGARLWQPNYFEHVIRNDKQLERACRYIQDNPRRWEHDKYHG